MNYKIETLAQFRKAAKKLSKKYRSFKTDLEQLGEELVRNPKIGVSIGDNCYKVRMAVSSKGKGKSGGVRIITHIYVTESTIYLLYAYDKSDQESLTDNYIKDLLKSIK